MSKTHYIELAKYLLERALKHVDSVETPLTFPVVPGKTYPQPDAPDWRYRSADFEAQERTFTLAAPLIHIDPETTINHIKLRDYYSLQFYNAFTQGIQIHCLCLKNCLTPIISLPVSLEVCSKHCFCCPTLSGPNIPKSRKMRWSLPSQNGLTTEPPRIISAFLIFVHSHF